MATTAAIGVPARSGRKGKAESNARDAELQNIHRAFAVIDKDHSGEVDRSELAELCLELGHQMTSDEVTQMLKAMDKTGSNTVTLDEFEVWWLDRKTNGEYIGNFNTDVLKGVLPNTAAIFFHLFEDPGWFDTMGKSGKPFKFTAVCLMLAMNTLIIVSTFAFCLETLPQFSADVETRAHKLTGHLHEADPVGQAAEWQSWWYWIEVVCVFMFTLDLVVRFTASIPARTAATFVTDPMNWVDFFAIFPFYVKFIYEDAPDLRFLRVVRLARVLRSVPSPRYQDVGHVVADLFVKAMAPLFVPIYFMILSMVTLSAVTYYAEVAMEYECHLPDGTIIENWDNTPAKNLGCLDEIGCECAGQLFHFTALDNTPRDSAVFSSIPDTFWWCTVTFTTVGYGDVNPVTPLGKVVGAVTMFIGIFFLAMPLAIIGSSFQDSWYKLDARAIQLEEEAKQAAEGEGDPGTPLKKEEEDNETFQDELQTVSHLREASRSLALLVKAASGQQGKYDEVQACMEQAERLMRDLAKASEDAVIAKVRQAEPKQQPQETRFLNPMSAAIDVTEDSAGQQETE